MKTHEIILCIIFNSWIPFVIYELFISTFIDWVKRENENRKWKKEHPNLLRKKCIDCKYCKWHYYHPFYKHGKFGNVMVTKEPHYCYLLKKQLSGTESRCKISSNSDAMWEDE